MRLDTKEWDVQKVLQDFHTDDIQLILQTRVPQNYVKDRIAWNFLTTGMYTVKSGYQYWSMQNAEVLHRTNPKGWNNLWKVEVPHKFRTFLWRVCNNNLPVRNALRCKGVNTTIICPMCEGDGEHLLHIFFDCSYAKECWQKAELCYDMHEVESAPDWLLEKLSTTSTIEKEKITMVLWGIWFAINQKMWEGKNITPTILMEIGSKQMSEWQEAMKKKVLSLSAPPVAPDDRSWIWHPADEGCLKLNVDASVFCGEMSFMLGMVLRDDQGQFVRGKTMNILWSVTVLEAEARGVHEALNWIDVLNLQKISIESDSELVVKAVKNDVQYYLEVGHNLDFCRTKFKQRDDLSLSHIKKQANNVAHQLARVPCVLNSSKEYLYPPNFLLETLCNG